MKETKKIKKMSDDLTYKRCAKIWDIRFTPGFREDCKKTDDLIVKIFKYVRKEIRKGTFVKIDSKYVVLKPGLLEDRKTPNERTGELENRYTTAEWKNHHQFLFKGVEKGNETLKRNILMYIFERHAGFSSRNGNGKFPTITHGRKGLCFRDRFVNMDSEKKTITIPTLYGKHVLKYVHTLHQDRIKTNEYGKFSGNLTYNNKTFVVGADLPFKAKTLDLDEMLDELDENEHFHSGDINKTQSAWVVLNNGTIIPMPKHINDTIKEVFEINKKLDRDKKKPVKEREYRSKGRMVDGVYKPSRRVARLKWKKLHGKLKGQIKIEAQKIIDLAVHPDDNTKVRAVVCIDGVGTGQTNGTFGQDHLKKCLQTLCEDQGMPYYVIPCKNTSRRCSKCGYTSKDNRKETETFKCLKCDHTESAHANAATNIAHQGKRLYEVGCPYGNYSDNKATRRSVDNLVKTYSESDTDKD
jgi:hypothetical protein